MNAIGIDTSYDVTASTQIGGEASLTYISKCRNVGYSGFGYARYFFSDRLSCRLDLRFYYQNQGVTRTGITGHFHAESASLKVNYEF